MINPKRGLFFVLRQRKVVLLALQAVLHGCINAHNPLVNTINKHSEVKTLMFMLSLVREHGCFDITVLIDGMSHGLVSVETSLLHSLQGEEFYLQTPKDKVHVTLGMYVSSGCLRACLASC